MDSHTLLRKFQIEHVALTKDQKSDMESKRDLNLKRAQRGLEANKKPKIVDTINQGGKAMDTMTHPPEGDEASRYDIDMGVVFDEADALGARTTRRWIADAIEEASPATMVNTPDIKNKCVRVVYSEGYQCDFPVFKRIPAGTGYVYEVSIGDEWVSSDPGAVNQWFRDSVRNLSPENSGDYQLRRIVRLVKYFAKVRALKTGTKFPAGLLVTAITVNNYVPVADRDDQAFYKTLSAIINSLRWSKQVYVDGVLITDDKDDLRLDRFVEAAEKATDDLARLFDGATDVSAEQTARAWKKVFSHSYFASEEALNQIEAVNGTTETKAANDGLSAAVALGASYSSDKGFEPKNPVNKAGGGTSG